MTQQPPRIFFSYAWGDGQEEPGASREDIVNELYRTLSAEGYALVRDKDDLGYRGLISEFMEQIGTGELIVIAISNKYLRSPFCMFELYEIARQSGFDKRRFRDRVLPVIVEPIAFGNLDVFLELHQYWQSELDRWTALVKSMSEQLSIDKFERYNRVRLIHQHFDQLTEWLQDMNTMSPEILSKENFAGIRKAIDARIPAPAHQPKPGDATVSTPPPSPAPVLQQYVDTGAPFRLAPIRKLLEGGLSDSELTGLCMDTFPEVQDRFGDGMSKLQKINLLLDFCRRQLRFGELLTAVQEINAAQFEIFKPYQ